MPIDLGDSVFRNLLVDLSLMKRRLSAAVLILFSSILTGQDSSSEQVLSTASGQSRSSGENALDCVQIATLLQTDWTELKIEYLVYSDYSAEKILRLKLLSDGKIEIKATQNPSTKRDKIFVGTAEKIQVMEHLKGFLPVTRAYAKMHKQGKKLGWPSLKEVADRTPPDVIAGTTIIMGLKVTDFSAKVLSHQFFDYYLKKDAVREFDRAVRGLEKVIDATR